MPKYFFSMLFLLLSPALLGTNLILNGSFDGDIKASEVRTNGGKFSIFTEELTWNTCGRLEVDRVMTMADGSQQHSAAAWIGATGKLPGFVAKPETTYQFSIEVRGEVQGRASISATCWHGDDIWRDYQRVKTTVEGFVVQKHWTVYKGTFTTTADTKRAALQVQIWENSKHGPLVYKVGDGILFDNVEVSEAKATLLTAAAPPKPELRRQQQNVLRSQRITAKITVDGRLDEPAWQNAPRAGDFQVLGKGAPADAATEVRVLSDKEYLYLGITCQEPSTIVAAQDGLGTGIWRDDILEVFFGPISEDRRLSQFAISAGGGRYLGYGNASNLPLDYDSWEGKTTVGKNSWQAELKVPLRMLSNTDFGAPGDAIAFNVARQRKQAKELSTWSPLRESFHEVENYGLLLVADFGAAWKKITG